MNKHGLKVFGIGLNRTGTSTLHECGKLLGFKVFSGYQSNLLCDLRIDNDLSRIISIANNFDLFQDWPWPLIYKQLDKQFSQSKFVLTKRKDPQTWLDSLKKFNLRKNPYNISEKLAYGYRYPHNKEEEFLEVYNKHMQEVRDYFSNRSNYLEICWEQGDGWQKLCDFLEVNMPVADLPHIQKSSDQRESTINISVNRLLIFIECFLYRPKKSTNIGKVFYSLKRMQEKLSKTQKVIQDS